MPIGVHPVIAQIHHRNSVLPHVMSRLARVEAGPSALAGSSMLFATVHFPLRQSEPDFHKDYVEQVGDKLTLVGNRVVPSLERRVRQLV